MQANAFCPSITSHYGMPFADYVSTARQRVKPHEGWPLPWSISYRFTQDPGSSEQIGLARMLVEPHTVDLPAEDGDPVALVRAAADSKGAARVALLEQAWRACPDPALAALILHEDHRLGKPKPPKLPKKVKEQQARWLELAVDTRPAALFALPWPSRWRASQERICALFERPRSPLLAKEALDLGLLDELPYTSIASQAFWQGLAWFIAGQGDVSQLDRLRSFEERIADFVDREETPATDALAAVVPPSLPPEAAELVARLSPGTLAPAPEEPLSLTTEESRQVASDALAQQGDPRGELIAIQTRIGDGQVDDALLKRERELLFAHAEAWCPNNVLVNTCVFRRGVPVEATVTYRSDAELRSLRRVEALRTLERIDLGGYGAKPETVVAFVASMPALRVLSTWDEAAAALAQGPATAITHICIQGRRAIDLGGPGLPKLTRLDVRDWRPSWARKPWFDRIDSVGTTDVDTWLELRRRLPDRNVVLAFDHGSYPYPQDRWELHWHGDRCLARPMAGADEAGLHQFLDLLAHWNIDRDGIEVEFDSAMVARMGTSLALLSDDG